MRADRTNRYVSHDVLGDGPIFSAADGDRTPVEVREGLEEQLVVLLHIAGGREVGNARRSIAGHRAELARHVLTKAPARDVNPCAKHMQTNRMTLPRGVGPDTWNFFFKNLTT